MQEQLLQLIIWFVLWIVVWFVVFYILFPNKIDYTRRYWFTSFYFLIVSFVALFLFHYEIRQIIPTQFTITPFVVVVFALVASVTAYKYVRAHFKKPNLLIRQNPNEFFLTLEYSYLISKTFEIMFQQIMIAALVVILSNLGFSLIETITIFALLFSIAHIPLFKTEGVFWAKYFLILSVASSVIFPLLILEVNYGFVYTYIIHWIFYPISGIFFWINPRLRIVTK